MVTVSTTAELEPIGRAELGELPATCRWCLRTLTEDDEDTQWGICTPCYDAGLAEHNSQALFDDPDGA